MYWLITPLIAALWDWKTGEIPDWITVPGIVASFLFIVSKAVELLPAFLGFSIVGYALYRYGLVGGGDVLLILAILPFLPWVFTPVISPFLLLSLAITLTAALYGFYLSIKDGKHLHTLPVLILPLGLSLLYGAYLLSKVGKERFVKEVSVKELQAEDVLAEPVKGFGKRVIEEGDKELLAYMGIERVKVYVNLPRMGPGILLSIMAMMFPHKTAELFFTSPVLTLLRVF